MTDPYLRAEEALVSLEQRTQYDEKNRLELLAVHGFKGLAVGMAIHFGGAPPAWNDVYGASTTVFLAAPAFLGGVLLLLGLAWNRNILLEALGMLGLLLWDILMIRVMFTAANSPYVPIIYLAMACLMGIHVRTLLRYLNARRKAAINGDR